MKFWLQKPKTPEARYMHHMERASYHVEQALKARIEAEKSLLKKDIARLSPSGKQR